MLLETNYHSPVIVSKIIQRNSIINFNKDRNNRWETVFSLIFHTFKTRRVARSILKKQKENILLIRAPKMLQKTSNIDKNNIY